ncbi:hypothetical protein SLEP1_g1 [Rubroshorea leprosula]|uniref:Uncharacterized protein n=1 Tax=Rubroshorea leprosula TaxID=152421 RepID=A0AAV5HG63_9ROSI|nr:hypothetical protein SLEP1_g1 [Rubroshorea leprosula]
MDLIKPDELEDLHQRGCIEYQEKILMANLGILDGFTSSCKVVSAKLDHQSYCFGEDFVHKVVLSLELSLVLLLALVLELLCMVDLSILLHLLIVPLDFLSISYPSACYPSPLQSKIQMKLANLWIKQRG